MLREKASVKSEVNLIRVQIKDCASSFPIESPQEDPRIGQGEVPKISSPTTRETKGAYVEYRHRDFHHLAMFGLDEPWGQRGVSRSIARASERKNTAIVSEANLS